MDNIKKRRKNIQWTPQNCKLVLRIIEKNSSNLQVGFDLAAKRLSKMYGIDISSSAVSAAYYSNKTLLSYKKMPVMTPIVCVVGNKIIESNDLQKNKSEDSKTPSTVNLLSKLYAFFKKN